jgi:class 3 adenylate cyclase
VVWAAASAAAHTRRQIVVVREVERFLASGREEEADLDRALATVLFTDIVASTEKAAELGDAPLAGVSCSATTQRCAPSLLATG